MEITSTVLGSILHLLSEGHSLMIKESLNSDLVIIAWYFGPLIYKGLSLVERFVVRVVLVRA